MSSVVLRPLREDDMDMLAAWLNQPHLSPHYMQEPITRNEVAAKFLPRTGGGHPVTCLIAETGGVSFGYVQWYFNRAFPEDSAAAAGEPDGVSLDYYVGEPGFLGRGLGATMLRACRSDLDQALRHPDRHIFIQHDDRNLAARRCTQAAGFEPVRAFTRGDVASSLYHAPPVEADSPAGISPTRRNP